METQQGDQVEAGNQDSTQSHILAFYGNRFIKFCCNNLLLHKFPVVLLTVYSIMVTIYTTCIIIKHLCNLYTL